MKIFKLSNVFRASIIFTSVFLFASCNTDKDDTDIDLDVPSTYEFTRNGNSTVSYSGQTERLDMLERIGTYLKSANIQGAAPLQAATLNNMFANENSPFSGATFEKNLKSKCYDVVLFENLFDAAAVASQATGVASSGTVGVLVDYRLNANGVELTQVILKGLMGSVFFYQATEVYLTADRMGTLGNESVDTGYTQMEHYFDEAFGYFGIPTDFPSLTTLEEARFWGEYCNKRDAGLYSGINSEIATAFRTARAAITAEDYDSRDAAIETIIKKWSVVIAASAVDYLNQGLSTSGTSNHKRHHVLSEAIGFMMALKYHTGDESKYQPHYDYSKIEAALTSINVSTDIYTVSDSEIQNAIDDIRAAFPAGEIK